MEKSVSLQQLFAITVAVVVWFVTPAWLLREYIDYSFTRTCATFWCLAISITGYSATVLLILLPRKKHEMLSTVFWGLTGMLFCSIVVLFPVCIFPYVGSMPSRGANQFEISIAFAVLLLTQACFALIGVWYGNHYQN